MVEYKIIEIIGSYGNAKPLEAELNKLSSLGFKISKVIPGFSTSSTTHPTKIILEREMIEK